MSRPTKKKGGSISLTMKQRKAAKFLLENGGTAADALRAAGYPPGMVKNPQKVTKSKGFIALLEKAGLTDTFLAKKHATLMRATRIESQAFDAFKKGKKWMYPTDENIRSSIEGTEEEPTGCKIVYIRTNTSDHTRTAIYRHPDNVVQKSALDMAYDVKGHFAPTKLDVIEHELSEEEAAALASLF